jgi:predicted glycosyltransferase
VLAEAELLVADTQTMVTEAALLGTPAIRSNSFVGEGDMGNFLELERQDLVFNIAEFDDVLEQAATLLETDGVKETWRARRDAFMAEKVNLTDLLVDLAHSKSIRGAEGITLRSTSVASA